MHHRTASWWLDRTLRLLGAAILALILGIAAVLAMLDARSGQNGELFAIIGRQLAQLF